MIILFKYFNVCTVNLPNNKFNFSNYIFFDIYIYSVKRADLLSEKLRNSKVIVARTYDQPRQLYLKYYSCNKDSIKPSYFTCFSNLLNALFKIRIGHLLIEQNLYLGKSICNGHLGHVSV